MYDKGVSIMILFIWLWILKLPKEVKIKARIAQSNGEFKIGKFERPEENSKIPLKKIVIKTQGLYILKKLIKIL